MGKTNFTFLLSSFRPELLIDLHLLQITSLVLCQKIFYTACTEIDP